MRFSTCKGANCKYKTSVKMESNITIKPDPDSVLAPNQVQFGIDNDHIRVDEIKEDPSMFQRPIKKEKIELPVETTIFIAEDEHYVFLDEKIEIKPETEESDKSGAQKDSRVTAKLKAECANSEQFIPTEVKCEVQQKSGVVIGKKKKKTYTELSARKDFRVTGKSKLECLNSELNYTKATNTNEVLRAPAQLLIPTIPAIDSERDVQQESGDSIGKKKKKTYAEMIGCYVVIEPMIISSTIIQNKTTDVDNCDTGRVLRLRRPPGAIGRQQLNRVFDKKRKFSVQEKAVKGGNKKELIDHFKRVTYKIKRVPCNICKKWFAGKASLSRHIFIHTGRRPFRPFDSTALDAHSIIHTGETLYKCKVCKKEYFSSASLISHSRIHTGEKPYKCEVCKKTFAHTSNLRVHRNLHTGEKPYKCKMCERRFSDPSNFRNHNKVHTGKKPYKCKICQKKYSKLSTLVVHTRIHTGEKPFKCKECKEAFMSSVELKVHARVHTGETPFKCEVCSKIFNASYQLKTHTRSHTGENPYVCKLCKESFSRLDKLKAHTRIHTGEKPYKCKVCKITFTEQGTFKRHISNCHGDRTYKCEESPRNRRNRLTDRRFSYKDISSSQDSSAQEADSEAS